MATVLSHMCMSLDGFIANPDDSPGELFDWYWGGDVPVASKQDGMGFSVDAASGEMLEELIGNAGVVIAGRYLFDMTDGWGDHHPGAERIVCVTHRGAPADAAERFPNTTFVDGVAEAVAVATEQAGDRNVIIASPTITQQALELGLVDEVCVSLIPTLFGEGKPYFAKLDRGHVLLEDPVVVAGRRALHLRYPVRDR